MLITCKPRIPFTWIVLATLPWAAVIMRDKALGPAFSFTVRKFVENPAALTFLISLPLFVSFILPPVVNFISDRIWTRYGRRKPFIVASWIGCITCLALLPLAPDFWWLIGIYCVATAFNDLGGPVESLKMEIVPPAQRVNASAIMQWLSNLGSIGFWVIAIGRFDDTQFMAGVPITGEAGLYWTVGLAMIVMLLFLMLGVKETDPKSALKGERLTFRRIFGGLLNEHLWPIYVLVVSSALIGIGTGAIGGVGLGVISTFLTTEQWGFTKQDMGLNIAIGGILNIFLIVILGVVANKMDKTKAFVGLIVASIVISVFAFCYYSFVLYDGRPSLLEMVVFGEMTSVVLILASVIYVPLVYDFIPRNEMGTFNAGSMLLGKGIAFIATNMVGLTVAWHSSVFLAPGGEMLRITLAKDTPTAEVQKILDQATWTDPTTGATLAKPRLTAQAWYATGAKLDHGRGFEIRIEDEKSVKDREMMENIDKDRNLLRIKENFERQQKKPDSATKADVIKASWQPLAASIANIKTTLDERCARFQTQVEQLLAPLLIKPGEQILAASVQTATLQQIPLKFRPETEDLELTLQRLRQAHLPVVDLRLIRIGEQVLLEVCMLDASAIELVRAKAAGSLREVMADAKPKVSTTAQILSMDLRILEEPMDSHISPINTAINAVHSTFGEPLGAERRILALSRSLRRQGSFEFTAALPVPGDINAVRVMTVLDTVPMPASASVASVDTKTRDRLQDLLGPNSASQAAWFYSVASIKTKEQRMTLAAPVISRATAKTQTDFLSGYLALFSLMIVGVAGLFWFFSMVRGGKIRKRGVEEAEAVK